MSLVEKSFAADPGFIGGDVARDFNFYISVETSSTKEYSFSLEGPSYRFLVLLGFPLNSLFVTDLEIRKLS